MSATAGDKTEAATPKKRLDAVKEGDSLTSRDVSAAAMLAAFAAWAAVRGQHAYAEVALLLKRGLTIEHGDLTAFEPGARSVGLLTTIMIDVSALAAILIVTAIASSLVTGGGRWTTKRITPKFSRLDPVKGFGRLLGAEAMVGLGQSLLKIGLLTGIAYHCIDRFFLRARGNALDAAGLALGACLAVAVVAAAIDLLVQWQRREKRLRMSKQEVRDEHKSTEGSPERKRAQRERQYAIAANSARKAMETATVVVNNPLHFAVALRYRPDSDGVPVVVARGTDEAARAIRDLASEHAVKQVESPMLARALYFTGRVGQPVAHDLYLAVATVLAFVFDLEAEAAGRRLPEVELPSAMRFDAGGRRMA